MKIKFLTILLIAGLAVAGCNSNKNSTSSEDSVMTDSTLIDTMGTDTAGIGTDTSGINIKDTSTVQ